MMSPQTLLHLFYFLPALIVYGIWTWIAYNQWKWYKNQDDLEPIPTALFVWAGMHLVIIIILSIKATIEGIKYFTN